MPMEASNVGVAGAGITSGCELSEMNEMNEINYVLRNSTQCS